MTSQLPWTFVHNFIWKKKQQATNFRQSAEHLTVRFELPQSKSQKKKIPQHHNRKNYKGAKSVYILEKSSKPNEKENKNDRTQRLTLFEFVLCWYNNKKQEGIITAHQSRFVLSYIFYREKQHRTTSVHINALTKLLLLRKINQLSWRNCTAHRPEKKTVSCAPERLSERHTVKKRDNDPLARIALKDRRRSTVAVRKEDNSNNSRSSKTCYYNRQKRTLVKKKTKIDRKC